MDDLRKRLHEEPTKVGVFLALGIGFTFHYVVPSYSTLGWVLGFGVVFPLIVTLFGDFDEASSGATETESSTDDALETLRRRYAAGELTDEQFERKVESLLETETVESPLETETVESATDPRRRERETE